MRASGPSPADGRKGGERQVGRGVATSEALEDAQHAVGVTRRLRKHARQLVVVVAAAAAAAQPGYRSERRHPHSAAGGGRSEGALRCHGAASDGGAL